MSEFSAVIIEFLRKDDIKDALAKSDFNYIYTQADEYRDYLGDRIIKIRELTKIFLTAEINPLKSNLKKIPADYAIGLGEIGSLYIDSTITSIGEYAFLACSNLSTVNFKQPSSLTRIESSAFERTSIKRIEIPDSVVSLDEEAFFNCSQLSEVIISPSSKLETLGDDVFAKTQVKKIFLPKSIKSIYGITYLNTITYGDSFEQWRRIQGIDNAGMNIAFNTIVQCTDYKAIFNRVGSSHTQGKWEIIK